MTVAEADVVTPPGRGGILSGQAVPAFLARIGARLAKNGGGRWRIGNKIVVAGHAQIQEALSRDLEFGIAPINGRRIAEVDDAFVLVARLRATWLMSGLGRKQTPLVSGMGRKRTLAPNLPFLG